MIETQVSKPKTAAPASKGTSGLLYVLDLSGGRIFTVNPDGSDKKIIVTDCRLPDGVVVDAEAGHIYWTNMGVPSRNDGSIERADLDGRNRKTIVPEGGTFTPKQLHLDKENRKLYWSDREGMRVMRSNLDGSQLETLVHSSKGDARPGIDQTKWCVGITVDPKRGKFYWTQKGTDKGGVGRIFRANLEMPKGQNAANRTDIEVLFDKLPEPIDLELDIDKNVLYWTDRGDPPRGNTVNRASIDATPGQAASEIVLNHPLKTEPEILVTHLMEGIGIALDLNGERMFVTDLAGSVYSARLDGSQKRPLLFGQGNLTGIAFAEIP
jgi:hypothetical protein